MAVTQVTDPAEAKILSVRLKRRVVEFNEKASVQVNGEHYDFSSELVTEAPAYAVAHLNVPYEVVAEAEPVVAKSKPAAAPKAAGGEA